MKKTYYAIKKTNFAVLAAAFLMLCGAAVRIVYYTGVRATAGELNSLPRKKQKKSLLIIYIYTLMHI